MAPLLRRHSVIRGDDGSLVGYGKPIFEKERFVGYEVRKGNEKFFVHSEDIIYFRKRIIIKPECLHKADLVIEKLKDLERFANPNTLTENLISFEKEASSVIKEMKDFIKNGEELIKRGKVENITILRRMVSEAKRRIQSIENSKIYQRIIELENKILVKHKDYHKDSLIEEIEKISKIEKRRRIRKVLTKIDKVLFRK